MTETRKVKLLAWALFFYLTLTIFYKAFTAIGLVLFLILSFYTHKESFKNTFNKKQLFFLLMLASMVLSNLYNGQGTYSKFKYYVIPFLFVAIIYEYGPKLSKTWIKRIIFWLLILSAISSLIGIITVLFQYNILKFQVDTYPRNQGALMGGAMYYSYPIAILCSMTLAVLVHYKKFREYADFKLLVITLIINLIGLYYSYTRVAMLAFIAGIPFILYYTRKKIFFSLFTAGLIAASCLAYILVNQIGIDVYRFQAKETDLYRVSLFKTGIEMFKRKPLLGYGVRVYEDVCPQIQEDLDLKPRFCANHSHNQFIDSLAMTGIVGGIIYLLFFGSWGFTYLFSYRDHFLFALPGFATYMAITMTDTPLYIGPVCSIIFVLYAMMFVPERYVDTFGETKDKA